ncbi:hypothetical protein AFLA_009374 [Aspergillus flavus NRRL3357]|nr:hypothetical protein AFLA_009374 [Aspergillus flavus NRRL3357]
MIACDAIIIPSPKRMLSLAPGAKRVAVVHPGLFGGQSCDVGKRWMISAHHCQSLSSLSSESVRSEDGKGVFRPGFVSCVFV